MIYVDTSVLVSLFVKEATSATVARWYGACGDELVSAAWCVTEFASALGLKQRRHGIGADEAARAWQAFERLCASDLQLLSIETSTFHGAATLMFDAQSGLRAGDALHLAAAVEAKATSMATLDQVLTQNARKLKLKTVNF